MNPDDLSIEQQLAIAAMAARAGFDEDALMGVAINPGHPGFAALWEHLNSQGIPSIQSTLGQNASAAEAAQAGIYTSRGEDLEESIEKQNLQAKLDKYSRDVEKSTGVAIDVSGILGNEIPKNILESNAGPGLGDRGPAQVPYSGAPAYLHPNNPKLSRARNSAGQWSHGLGDTEKMRLELEASVRSFLGENWQRLQIGEVRRNLNSGTLLRSLQETIVTLKDGGDGGFSAGVSPRDMARPARSHEAQAWNTALYGDSVFRGHRAILPKKAKRLIYIGNDGKVRSRPFIEPTYDTAKDVFDWTPEQIDKFKSIIGTHYTMVVTKAVT